VTGIRRQLAREMGLFVSPIRIRDNMNLGPNEYSIHMKGIELERGEILPDHHLCIASPEERGDLQGIETREPAFQLPAIWIPEREREKALSLGLTLVDSASVLCTHLSEIVRRHADEIMSREDVKHLVDGVREVAPSLVDELIPSQVNLGFLQGILGNLLQERVPIRDLVTILETIGDHAGQSASTDFLSEKVREALGRGIVREYLDKNDTLNVMTLSPKVEDLFMEALKQYGETGGIFLSPEHADSFKTGIRQEAERMARQGLQPLILVSSPIRLVFRRFTETLLPGLPVLAFTEVPLGTEVKAMGMVNLHE
ncbi:MAG: FHIPEP family type III secretion protein, partial [Candidatus Krumholzibacteria bacterium]|nr:FHIPEP family type III secretion protein [Candidatus Krumholzibacteria bacterium]